MTQIQLLIPASPTFPKEAGVLRIGCVRGSSEAGMSKKFFISHRARRERREAIELIFSVASEGSSDRRERA